MPPVVELHDWWEAMKAWAAFPFGVILFGLPVSLFLLSLVSYYDTHLLGIGKLAPLLGGFLKELDNGHFCPNEHGFSTDNYY